MKINFLVLLFIFICSSDFYGQKNSDSIVLFKDLRFHSEFEKKAIINYIKYKTDTFNLFMGIDSNINDIRASACYDSYLSFFGTLGKKTNKGINSSKQVKEIFESVHEHFLVKYNEYNFFPQIFIEGTYNCVSASILYALIFKQLNIPYKIYQTPIHVYLIANIKDESLIIETTNPDIYKESFSEDYKKQYISNLRIIKMISENEAYNKSDEELFYEKYYKATEAEFDNLSGFEYYNKGVVKLKAGETVQAYELFQKAYFFFPDFQIKNTLYSTLLQVIQNCSFKKISDIDYLVQFSRFKNDDGSFLVNNFIILINYNLQFTDKLQFCDSLYMRLIDEIPDKNTVDDISFNYYLILSKHFVNSSRMNPYIEKAISIKQNHIEANNLFIENLEKRLDKMYDFNELIDSITLFEQRYQYQFVKQLFEDYRLIAYLSQAYEHFTNNRISEGNISLRYFEEHCPAPVEQNRKKLVRAIESTYRILSMYYFYRNQKQKARQIVEHGLKYIPDSRYIQTAVY